jgi:hypothetical protein
LEFLRESMKESIHDETQPTSGFVRFSLQESKFSP